MTYDEAVAMPDGTMVRGVQPCDGQEYIWIRDHEDVIEPELEGGRVLVYAPEPPALNQHKFLFVPAAQLDLV